MRRQPYTRAQRLGHQLQREISTLLSRGVVHDPEAVTVTVTRVDLSKDLRIADVYIQRRMGMPPGGDPVAGLNRAAGFLRHRIAPRLVTKVIPTLRFHLDTTLDILEKLGELLSDVQADPKTNRPSDPQTLESSPDVD